MPKDLVFANKAQEEFFYSEPSGVLGFYGGFGSGKSTILCVKLLWVADTFPGAQIAIVRRTASQLRKTTMATLMTWLPSDRIARFNEQIGVIEMRNGSKIFLIHLDDESSLGVLKSLELTAAGVDQAEEVEARAVDLLEKRVGRWRGVKVPEHLITPNWAWRDHNGQPVAPKWMLLSFNCPGFDSYIWERFAEEAPERARWAARGYRYVHASSRDNPFLGQSNLESLLAGGEEFVARYVDVVTWGVTEGRVFDLTDASILEYEPGLMDKIRRGMKLHRSLDHGETAPTCCLWWATDHDGNIFCVSPETRILTSDLRHVTADSLQPGDSLTGFDENVPLTGKRRWRKALVEAVEVITQPRVRVHLDDGTSVTSSENHLWLAQQLGGRILWIAAKNLRPGWSLHRSTEVWDVGGTYEDDYIAGALDGEGSFGINNRGTPRLNFTQNRNVMLSVVEDILTRRGVRFGTYHRPGLSSQLCVTSKTDILRILGETRPKRLLQKFDVDRLGGFAARYHPIVTRVEFIGPGPVVAIKTSTKTFVAEGLASHNCFREYYESDRLVSDHRKAICAISKDDHTKYHSNLADPSIFAKARGRDVSSGPRWSVADEYMDTRLLAKDTAIYWTAADNGEEVTRSRLKEYLRIDPNHRHPVTGHKGAPHLYFIKKSNDWPNGCDKTIKELRSQRYVTVGESSDGKALYSEERDPTVSDHSVDAVRYFVVSRPSLGLAPMRPPAEPGSIYIDQYFKETERVRIGKRRQERLTQVAKAGYG